MVAANGDSPPPQLNHQRPAKDQNCIRISTQRSFVDPRDNDSNDGNTFGRYLPTETANAHIRTALLNTPPTQDALVAGVGTTKTGYVICFKDQASTNAARSNLEWLNELGNNIRLVKPRFGIVVHRTPTKEFDLENANAQAIEKVTEENELTERGFQIEEVAWLKKKDKALGKFASLGIWFDSAGGSAIGPLLVAARYTTTILYRQRYPQSTVIPETVQLFHIYSHSRNRSDLQTHDGYFLAPLLRT